MDFLSKFLSRKFLTTVGGVVVMVLVAKGIDEATAQAAVGACIAAIIAVYNIMEGRVDVARSANGGEK